MCFSRNSILKNNLLCTLENILIWEKPRQNFYTAQEKLERAILKAHRQTHDIINVNTNPVRYLYLLLQNNLLVRKVQMGRFSSVLVLGHRNPKVLIF